MPKVEKYIARKRVRGTDFITGTDKDGNVVRFSGAFFIREIVNESNYLSLVLDEQEARIAADELLNDKISVLGEQLGIRISQNESGLVQLESNINNELYGPGGITESYTSAITQSAEAISLSVEKELYGPGGIEESYSSLIQQTASSITLSVDGKLYGPGGIEASYTSKIQQTADSITSTVDEKLYGPGGVEESYSSLIQQTARSIVLSVESELYGPDGIQRKYTSAITQLSSSIDLSVFTNGKLNAGILIERVNDYEGAVKIAADKITISGDTVFTQGYDPSAKTQTFRGIQPTVPYSVNDQWFDDDGNHWVCVQFKNELQSFDANDWIEATRYIGNTELSSFVTTEIDPIIDDLQKQTDNKLVYYFSLSTEPIDTTGWGSEHVYNKWYQTDTKLAYEWREASPGVFRWVTITDTVIIDLLKRASKAQDTADGKRRVFVDQPPATPDTPYDVGDMWVQGPGGDILTCVVARQAGAYVLDDFQKWNKYTDDTSLDAFLNGEYADDLLALERQIDQKADAFYQDTMPHPEYMGIAANPTYDVYVSDLWHNSDPEVKKSYIYQKQDAGAGLFNYVWVEQEIPKEVFDTIDGKSSIYVSKPLSYNERDLWITESESAHGTYGAQELLTATQNSDTYSDTHWVKKVKYTDDTEALKKTTRYLHGTDPSLEWDNATAHIGDEWVVYAEFVEATNSFTFWTGYPSIPTAQDGDYHVREFLWDGAEWDLNQVEMSGGLLLANTVSAEKLIVDEVLAGMIYASGAEIGGFTINETSLQLGTQAAWNPSSGTEGLLMGIDPLDSKYKFYLGDVENHLIWNGENLIISGFALIGDGTSTTTLNDLGKLEGYFEIVNEGQANEYLKLLAPLAVAGEVQAWASDPNIFPPNIWSSLPLASNTTLGAVRIGAGLTYNAVTGMIAVDGSVGTGFDESSNYSPSGTWAFSGSVSVGGSPVATQAQLNAKANKNGSSTENFTVKDLIIHGTVNHWLADVITIDDAKLQLNRKQGNATVASGLDIYNGTSVVASIDYSVAGNWIFTGGEIYQSGTKVALQNVSISAGNGLSGGGSISANRTITLGTPSTITNSTTNSVDSASHTHAISLSKSDIGLGNVGNYSDYARKTISESVSGFWHFNEGVSIGTTCHNSANSTRYYKIGYFTLPNQYNWGHVTIQVKTRHGANHTIFAGVERTATNVSVYRTFQVIGKVLNQTYYLVRTSANVMELWLRNIQSYDNVQISILNRSTAHKFTPDFNVNGTTALPTNESVVTCTNIIKTDDSGITTTGSLNVSGNGVFSGSITAGGHIVAGSNHALLASQTAGNNVNTGLSLYGGGTGNAQTYGIQFMRTATAGYGTHGSVTGEWAMYFNMSNSADRGWIFRGKGGANAASISVAGHFTTNGNIVAGSTSTAANRVVRVLTNNSYAAGFEAYGAGEGTGYLYVGQDSNYGGGIEYNGDNKPVTTGASSDHIALYRRSNGVSYWTARNYPNNNNWEFRGNITARGEVTAYSSSDKRLKSNITPLTSSLSIIDKLNPVSFNWNDKAVELNNTKNTLNKNYGVIAQEIEEVLPDLVHETNGFKSVDYIQLIGVLLASVKELNNKIIRLENRSNGSNK